MWIASKCIFLSSRFPLWFVELDFTVDSDVTWGEGVQSFSAPLPNLLSIPLVTHSRCPLSEKEFLPDPVEWWRILFYSSLIYDPSRILLISLHFCSQFSVYIFPIEHYSSSNVVFWRASDISWAPFSREAFLAFIISWFSISKTVHVSIMPLKRPTSSHRELSGQWRNNYWTMKESPYTSLQRQVSDCPSALEWTLQILPHFTVIFPFFWKFEAPLSDFWDMTIYWLKK